MNREKSAIKGWFLEWVLVEMAAIFFKRDFMYEGELTISLVNDYMYRKNRTVPFKNELAKKDFFNTTVELGEQLLFFDSVDVNFKHTLIATIEKWKEITENPYKILKK